jgi:N-acetyltransferase
VWERLGEPLAGRVVRLEPLAAVHRPGLAAAARDAAVWRWMAVDASRPEVFTAWFDETLAASEAGAERPYATLDARTSAILGSTRFMALAPEHRRAEIGYTWLARRAWGSGANTEAKYLMLRHAFEDAGCLRVEFKTDALNERSRAALAALPAVFEGVHRRHMLVRGGERRDSAWYSVVAEEWPEVRAALERRLAADYY